jgi:uncharacterized protein YndB with AHSA1/START domain
MEARDSIEIAAPPAKVWPFLVEPEKILKWCPTFKKFEYTGDKRSGPGTTFYVEEKSAGPLMKLNFRVDEWEENGKIAFSMTSGNVVKSYQQAWTLEQIPSGSRFSFMERFEMPYGFIGKLIESMGRSSSEATIKKMLVTLKSLAEAS